MPLAGMHREDVKAELRKRFGSVAAFERQHGLPLKSVTDLLRGQSSARVERAVTEAIFPKSEVSDDSGNGHAAHRLNAEAR